MWVVHKATPPTQHGRSSTPQEDEAADYLSEALSAAAAATPVTLADAAAHNAAEAISERFAKALTEQPGWSKFTALLQGAADLGALRTVRKAASAPTLDPGNFTLVNPAVAGWADAHSADMVTKITDTTKANINAMVNGAVRGKMTVTQLTTGIASALPLTETQAQAMNNAVNAYYQQHSGEPGAAEKAGALSGKLGNGYTKTRAKMIARTELSNAQNAGHYISMSQSIENGTMEPGTVKEWSTAEDEATCPICRPYDGQIVKWDEAFGNGLMTPPAHPNCRCTFNDLPPDALEDPGFTPLPSEEELYGNTVTPQKPSPGWVGAGNLTGDTATKLTPMSKVFPGISKEAEDAVARYTANSFETNAELRWGATPKGTDLIDQAIRANELPKATTVLRVVSGDAREAIYQLASRGGVYADQAYMSTQKAGFWTREELLDNFATADIANQVRPVVFEIKLPKGYHALDISGNLDDNPLALGFDQGEVLLPRGAKFRTSKPVRKDDYWLIRLTPDDASDLTGNAGIVTKTKETARC